VVDVAREVVQAAQRDRTAVIAAERARSRAAEARAAHAEAALEAAQAAASQKDAGADGPPVSPRRTPPQLVIAPATGCRWSAGAISSP
jgi:hypothetical protein